MMRTAKITGILALAMLAGCGKVGPLEPKAGQTPPAKSYGQEAVPTPDDLMKPTEQSRPGRSDELMRRSERRTNDPFDLPPGSEGDKDKKPLPVAKSPEPKPQ
jgi:predicted small lipoprotein YifL